MAVGFDASGDYARITANLPDVYLFTACGFARLKTERDWQVIFSLDDADTEYLQVALDNTSPTRNLTISSSTLGAGGAFGSRPANDTWFFWAISNKGPIANVGLQGYWTYLDPVSMVTYDNDNASDFAANGLYLGNDGYDDYGGVHLAHVRVWDVELSQSELEAEAASATPVRTANLRAYWPLANNTDTGDDSGNGYDLTFGGTLTSETSPTFGSAPAPNVSDGITLGESQTVKVSDPQVSVSDSLTVGESHDVDVISDEPGGTLSVSVTPDNPAYQVRGVRVHP